MILTSVDLPAPFWPTSPWTCPRCSVKSTPWSTSTPPKDLRMPRAASTTWRVSAMDGMSAPTIIGSCLRCFPQAESDGHDDDQAACDHLLRDREAHEDEAVVEHAHDQRTHERPDHRTPAARHAGATDDRR